METIMSLIRYVKITALSLVAGVLAAAPAAGQEETPALPPLEVCATVPDLGDLARQAGGDQVDVAVFARGPQDPHFLEPRPSFIKELSGADLFLMVGLDLETGWAPNLWQNARNGRVLPGAPGFLDASTAIAPRDLPAGPIDRAMGDVHPSGNPHYLLDPVNGLKVARAIRDRLIQLRVEKRAHFTERYDAFAKRMNEALVGEKLAALHDGEKLAVLHERGALLGLLEGQKKKDLLGGWVGLMAPHRGARVVADHKLWPYFAARFGIEVVAYLEPKPGIAPSTGHLAGVVKLMKEQGVKVIITVPYFDRRHAAFVASKTGATVVSLAHQCGALPGTEEYIGFVDHNVRQLAKVLAAAGSGDAR
jgi:ABC-type Zn uptake system ZnuABC Zn-binding protein ZnuA